MAMTTDIGPLDAANQNRDESPGEPAPATASPEHRLGEHQFRRAVRYAVIQQFVMLVISAAMLDGGDMLKLCLTAAILSCAPVAVIAFRQCASSRCDLSTLDIAAIRYSFWAFFVAMCILHACNCLPSNWYFINRVRKANPVIEAKELPRKP
jgi:hypothetical protein